MTSTGGSQHDENRLWRRIGNRDGNPVPGPVLNALFLITGGLGYLLNVTVLKHTGVIFFSSYFNDVLAGAILLAFSNMLAADGTFSKRVVSSFGGGLAIIAAAVIVWEIVTPRVLQRSVGDPADALCYLVGALIYIVTARFCRAGVS